MIFPVFLFVCIFLVYMGFYQYDRCIVEQSLHYAMVRGKELSHASEEEYEDILQGLFEETLWKQYLINVSGEVSGKTQLGRTELIYNGEMPVPWIRITDSNIENKWEVEVSGETEPWKPVDFIRFYNRLKGE